jgi:hypothetical protein
MSVMSELTQNFGIMIYCPEWDDCPILDEMHYSSEECYMALMDWITDLPGMYQGSTVWTRLTKIEPDQYELTVMHHSDRFQSFDREDVEVLRVSINRY